MTITSKHEIWRRRLPIGAEIQPAGGVHFRVWAPKRSEVEVVFSASTRGDPCEGESLRLKCEAGGYFSGFAPAAGPGTRYRFRLDDGDAFPDPASRFQPEGPHGPSEVVDPYRFPWTDENWPGTRRD